MTVGTIQIKNLRVSVNASDGMAVFKKKKDDFGNIYWEEFDPRHPDIAAQALYDMAQAILDAGICPFTAEGVPQ